MFWNQTSVSLWRYFGEWQEFPPLRVLLTPVIASFSSFSQGLPSMKCEGALKRFLSFPQCWCGLQTDTQIKWNPWGEATWNSASNYTKKIEVMRHELPQLLSSHFPTYVSLRPNFSLLSLQKSRDALSYILALPTPLQFYSPTHSSHHFLSSTIENTLNRSSTNSIHLQFIRRVSREKEKAMGRKMKFEVF